MRGARYGKFPPEEGFGEGPDLRRAAKAAIMCRNRRCGTRDPVKIGSPPVFGPLNVLYVKS